jgi:hypothetical protein
VLVGRRVVHIDGPMLATMADEVRLAVAVDVQRPDAASTIHR